MSDLALVPDDPPRRPLPPATTKRRDLGHKLRIAIDAMIFDGKPIDAAAKIANTSTRAIRKAMERPHVVAYMRRRREVFRAAVSAETIHHAAKIMRKGRNEMAKLKAMSFIENSTDEHHAGGVSRASPGLTIVVHGNAQIAAAAPQAFRDGEQRSDMPNDSRDVT